MNWTLLIIAVQWYTCNHTPPEFETKPQCEAAKRHYVAHNPHSQVFVCVPKTKKGESETK